MSKSILAGLAVLVMAVASIPATKSIQLTAPHRHLGVCDASAAVAVGDGRFLVADDEDNCLRLYAANSDGQPLQPPLGLSESLELGGESKEVDWEAATRLGGRLVWLTSHGNNKEGKFQERRHRLLGLTLKESGGKVEVGQAGKPYRRLLEDLLAQPELKKLKLDQLKSLAPEQGGVNIEGLSATPDGRLLIAFRSPVPQGKALVVAMTNPQEVLDGGARAQFAAPSRLDLGGLGVRSIEYAAKRKAYLILAGPAGDGAQSRLYEWDGQSVKPKMLADLRPLLTKLQVSKESNPEALVVYPESGRVQVLLDGGDQVVTAGGQAVRCKDVRKDALKDAPCRDAEGKHFSSVWLK
jgi:hypothetical protein